MTGNPVIALLFGCDWSIFNERIKKINPQAILQRKMKFV